MTHMTGHARAGDDGGMSGWVDPREQIEFSVLMANGRLAGRTFGSRAEAEAWAQADETVVEYNLVCECAV